MGVLCGVRDEKYKSDQYLNGRWIRRNSRLSCSPRYARLGVYRVRWSIIASRVSKINTCNNNIHLTKHHRRPRVVVTHIMRIHYDVGCASSLGNKIIYGWPLNSTIYLLSARRSYISRLRKRARITVERAHDRCPANKSNAEKSNVKL